MSIKNVVESIEKLLVTASDWNSKQVQLDEVETEMLRHFNDFARNIEIVAVEFESAMEHYRGFKQSIGSVSKEPTISTKQVKNCNNSEGLDAVVGMAIGGTFDPLLEEVASSPEQVKQVEEFEETEALSAEELEEFNSMF
jgi:hypothetical protein